MALEQVTPETMKRDAAERKAAVEWVAAKIFNSAFPQPGYSSCVVMAEQLMTVAERKP